MVRLSKNNYHEILLQKLGNLDDYEYAGGYKSKLNKEKNNYMLKFESEGIVYPELKKKCECNHWIIQNCYVRNIHTKEIFVIGNCCIKHFKIKKKCSECNIVHRRTKSTICIDCEKKEKNKEKNIDNLSSTKINFGKYKGYSIRYVEEKDIDYLKYIHDNFDLNKTSKTNAKKIYDYLNLIVTVSSDTS